MKCLNRDALEYQILKQVSGVSGFDLDSCIRYYLDNHDRYPHLDEIPGANSEFNLEEVLEIKNVKGIQSITLKKVSEFTGSNSIEEAIPILNNKFRDLEINITPIDSDIAIININHRPSEYGFIERNIEVNNNSNSRQYITNSLNKLSNLYGINLIEITTDELNSEKWKELVPEAHSTNAFIYNGNIYINTDVISNKEEPKIHELLHIFLGAMRYSNPDMYFKAVSTMEQLPNIQNLSLQYKNRTHTDILEEIFVSEYAKYLTGQDSMIKNFPKNVLSEINYNIRRNLDSVLRGKYSVKALEDKEIMFNTLPELSTKVESDLCSSISLNFVNAASIHRKIANTKEGLINNGTLQEECI